MQLFSMIALFGGNDVERLTRPCLKYCQFTSGCLAVVELQQLGRADKRSAGDRGQGRCATLNSLHLTGAHTFKSSI